MENVEVEEQQVFNRLYVIKNKLSNRYGAVMMFPTDDMALYQLSKQIPVETREPLEHFELYFVGKLNFTNAKIVPVDPILVPFSREHLEIAANTYNEFLELEKMRLAGIVPNRFVKNVENSNNKETK